MKLDNIIAINPDTLSVKFDDITDEDYIHSVVLEITDRTMEILMSSKTPLEEVQDIIKNILDWVIK